jgi:major membrane immunogen (membrane-anchored lipoprotein)
MKRIATILSAAVLAVSLTACGSTASSNDSNTATASASAAVPFSAEYTIEGTTSSGKPKSDTFIFEGETTDGIITTLNFDIIRNKGTETEYSKKDLSGYMMNISDATIESNGDQKSLTGLSAYGYDPTYGEGTYAQYMVTASCDTLTDDTKFSDLSFHDDARSTQDAPVSVELDKALIAYSYLAKEAGIESLTADTPVKDLVSLHGLYKDGAYVDGTNRVSFAGYNGGRSYGEQIDAIKDYILANNMTLEDVYNMFKTVNQPSTDIADRDLITGATISFVGDFQRMAYLAWQGELYEGVTNTTTDADGNTKVEVVTQGFGGEIETHVTFDADKKITAISVRDAMETEDVGGVLTADDSEFIQSLINGQDDIDGVDAVSGATVTSTAMKNAVKYAQEEINK